MMVASYNNHIIQTCMFYNTAAESVIKNMYGYTGTTIRLPDVFYDHMYEYVSLSFSPVSNQ